MTAGQPVLTCWAISGIGEIGPGDDLAALIGTAADLRDGDVVVVTSKVVSKAEGRILTTSRDHALDAETDRVVARRGPTSIVRTHHGLVMAAAGIDASNTEPGTVVLLPVDPDASARALRERLALEFGANVAVLITDTSGRAWRNGQTDLAVGAAGIDVLHDLSGRTDSYGNMLAVTAPAVADEVAGTADLVKGKLGGFPVAVLRGLAPWVLAPGEHGPGARALVRDEATDMFGLGAREAVLHAAAGDPAYLRGFGGPAAAGDLTEALTGLLAGAGEVRRSAGTVQVHLAVADPRALGRLESRLVAVAFAHGWTQASVSADTGPSEPTLLSFHPGTP